MPRSYHGIQSLRKVYARKTGRNTAILVATILGPHANATFYSFGSPRKRFRDATSLLEVLFATALQKTNYAGYGSYYVKVMENIEKMYPGLKDLLKQNGPYKPKNHFLLELQLSREESKRSKEMPRRREESSHLKWTLNRATH